MTLRVILFSKEGLNDEKDPVARQELQALSSSIKNLLAQWFAVGLLELRRVTWDSPGSILEKVLAINLSLLLAKFILSLIDKFWCGCYCKGDSAGIWCRRERIHGNSASLPSSGIYYTYKSVNNTKRAKREGH